MGKTASSLSNMVISLVIVTLIAGGSLGYVYRLTEGPISEARQSKQKDAIAMVVPEFDNDPGSEMYEITSQEGQTLKVFPAKMEGELVGIAIESITNKGFGGEIKVMVGFKPDGTIYNYQVLEHKETPGLGTKMADWFKPQSDGESSEKQRSPFFDQLFGIKAGEGGNNRSIVGKNPETTNLTVSKDGGEIDAITAATISSRAFLDAIRVAYFSYAQTEDTHSSATKKNTEGDQL